MKLTVKKRGRSLVICLPPALMASCGIKEGTTVDLIKTPKGVLVRPILGRKPTLGEMLARMKGPNPYGEIDIGGSVGREIL